MRVLALSVALMLLAASAASAACPNLPDSAATGYSANNTARAVCLQQELARDTELAARQARIDAELAGIQAAIEHQRQLMLAQQALNPWPSPAPF